MCVIIVKEKNGVLPKKEALETSFKKNPDGAGFMYVESGKVVIDKGYMTFKSFYKHFRRLCRKFNNFENKNLVMHMRISTSGGVERENTHPFPITDSIEDMFKLYSRCEVGLAHNGIISATKPNKEQESKKINDTMMFIKIYLSQIYAHWKECFNNQAFLAGIAEITNSKFAILDKEDNLHLIGNFIEHEGSRYSNASYYSYVAPTKKYNYTYSKYDGYDQYGYYDDYGYYGDYYDYDYPQDKKKYEEIDEDEESSLIVLEDSDLYALSYEDDYNRIENLRTEENSIFMFDKDALVLKEYSSDLKRLLKSYYSAFVYDESEMKLY